MPRVPAKVSHTHTHSHDGRPAAVGFSSSISADLYRLQTSLGEAIPGESPSRVLAEECSRMLFEQSALGVCILECGPSLRPIRINAAMCEIIGYTEQEVGSRSPMDVTHPEDWAREVRLMREVERGRRPSLQMEKRYIRKDGSEV